MHTQKYTVKQIKNSIVQSSIIYVHLFVEQNLEMMLLPSSGFRVNGFSAEYGTTGSSYIRGQEPFQLAEP